ncbi:hypothetical protein ACFWOT_34325 [Streptomyces sp. NPDC058440]|uniref:hypothetical protein n=1 Tax=Streptomyces sp. NPDC058440 TaxID=3346501 RepID=UPI00364A4C01
MPVPDDGIDLADAAPSVDVEDPPEPQRYVEAQPFPADPAYELRLSGLDGQGADSGEIRYEGDVVATLQLSFGNGWFARLAVNRLPADVTSLSVTPQTAADRAAVLFSVMTGVPYGEAPAAAAADGPLTRADVLRAELRDTALQHREALINSAERVSVGYHTSDPRAGQLLRWLGTMADARSDAHTSRQMAAELGAVQEAAKAWGQSLPEDPRGHERQLLAFPLAHLLHDVQRLQLRLQATVDAARAERAAMGGQVAEVAPEAAPAPSVPSPDPAPAQSQPPADASEATPTEAPGPAPAADRSEPSTAAAEPSEQPVSTGTGAQAPPTPQETAPAEPSEDSATSAPAEPDIQTEPAVPANAPEGAPMATPASTTPPEEDAALTVVATESTREALQDAGLLTADQPDTASGRSETTPTKDLPLWTGADSATGDSPQTAAGFADIRAEFEAVQQVWTEHVPAERYSAADLYEAVKSDLRTLQQLLADALPSATPTTAAATAAAVPPAPAESAPAPEQPAERAQAPDGPALQQEAGAVNTALQGTDTHAAALRELPERQQIQTVRGAWSNLWRVIRERAGESFGRLRTDGRVGEFFRKVSLRACERIAQWAQAGAERLRRDGDRPDTQSNSRDLSSAEALLRLGDAALSYSGPRGGHGGTPPAATGTTDAEVNLPQMRKLGEALNRPLPTGNGAGRGSGVSAAAARGRYTTGRKKAKQPGGTTEQAGHLRRGDPEQQQGRKPTQR